jgi:hypothetical protein
MEKKEKRKNTLLPLVALAAFFGFIAGITGEIIIRTYFFNDYSAPYFNNEFNINDLNNNRSSLIIRDAKKVVVSQDVKVEETMNSVQNTLLRIFKRADITKEDLLVKDALATSSQAIYYYDLNRPDFIALSITSDGWVAASLPEDVAVDFDLDNYIAIDNDRRIYNLDEMSDFKELPGNLSFFHLEGANNMPIRPVADRSSVSLGQSAVMVADFDSVYLTSVSAIEFPEGILSSDELNVRLNLAGDLSERFANSFVFNLAGDLVAVVGSNRELIPAFSYTHYWQSFFSDKEFSQPFFGVNYLDLSRIKVLDLEKSKGALLFSSDDILAVLSGSPAEEAGLQAGDIITWINNVELDYNHDLSSIIATFKPGDEVTVSYLRSGMENSVKIKLGVKK